MLLELIQQLWLINNKPVIVLGDPSMIDQCGHFKDANAVTLDVQLVLLSLSDPRVKSTFPCAIPSIATGFRSMSINGYVYFTLISGIYSGYTGSGTKSGMGGDYGSSTPGPTTPGDPMSDKSSNGLDISVCVTLDSSESGMTGYFKGLILQTSEAIWKTEDCYFAIHCKGKATSQAHGQILNEEELAFLADPDIPEGQSTQTPKLLVMANESHYGSDALAEVHNHDNMNNNMAHQAVQVMPSSQQSNVVNHSETKITSDSNIIPYSQYVIESRQNPHFSIRPTNVSMVNTSLKKLKHHLANFDVVVKERTTPTAITEGSWGFKHTKACFRDEIIPFVKALKDLFSTFNQHLVDELSEVQNVFYQMEQAVEQHRIESKTFEVKMNQVLNENERLLEQVMSKDIVNLIANSSVDNDSVNVRECQKCLKLETELQTDFVEKETYDKLFKSFTILEKHCISLEVDTQLKQEIFQRENSVSNQSVPSFDQLFELNELKAQSQEKDTVIKKLKERIKSLSGKIDKDKIKQDFEEIETINIELDHRVTKLIAENEHLKQTYKQLYDSIKPARIQSKEQCAKLISQVNLKSVEIFDLNASLQEKALAITALKDELRKLKGKALVDNNVSNHPSDPELHQVNVEPITPKLLNKRTAHSAYIKHSQEEAAVLRDLVDHIKANYPLDLLLESAYKYTKLIQEMLSKISKTCPSINRIKQSTSASGSQPSGNTKKDKIQQTPSSTLKNKVEAYPMKVKSSLKNKECVVAPKGTAHVQHSKLNLQE
ncbi:hypothetical protein Tco_1532361 [Tanacetum coccineum]